VGTAEDLSTAGSAGERVGSPATREERMVFGRTVGDTSCDTGDGVGKESR
jgi:hypothetical protein